jgi:hypothetical protein
VRPRRHFPKPQNVRDRVGHVGVGVVVDHENAAAPGSVFA